MWKRIHPRHKSIPQPEIGPEWQIHSASHLRFHPQSRHHTASSSNTPWPKWSLILQGRPTTRPPETTGSNWNNITKSRQQWSYTTYHCSSSPTSPQPSHDHPTKGTRLRGSSGHNLNWFPNSGFLLLLHSPSISLIPLFAFFHPSLSSLTILAWWRSEIWPKIRVSAFSPMLYAKSNELHYLESISLQDYKNSLFGNYRIW